MSPGRIPNERDHHDQRRQEHDGQRVPHLTSRTDANNVNTLAMTGSRYIMLLHLRKETHSAIASTGSQHTYTASLMMNPMTGILAMVGYMSTTHGIQHTVMIAESNAVLLARIWTNTGLTCGTYAPEPLRGRPQHPDDRRLAMHAVWPCRSTSACATGDEQDESRNEQRQKEPESAETTYLIHPIPHGSLAPTNGGRIPVHIGNGAFPPVKGRADADHASMAAEHAEMVFNRLDIRTNMNEQGTAMAAKAMHNTAEVRDPVISM